MTIERDVARKRMQRYVDVLTHFASLPDDTQSVTVESIPHNALFSELKHEGLVAGDFGVGVAPETHLPSGPPLVLLPGISVSGIAKLAELSEYLWRTSPWGKVVASMIQLLWLVVGVIIGGLGTLYVTGIK